jgi:hypothetical protein
MILAGYYKQIGLFVDLQKQLYHNRVEKKNDPRGILQTNRTICRSSETTVSMRERRKEKQQQQQQTRSRCGL